jgi:ferredoxin
MKIRTDVEACVGSGQCVVIAPRVFDVDDDGKVVVRKESPRREDSADVRSAAFACPAFAIEIDES